MSQEFLPYISVVSINEATARAFMGCRPEDRVVDAGFPLNPERYVPGAREFHIYKAASSYILREYYRDGSEWSSNPIMGDRHDAIRDVAIGLPNLPRGAFRWAESPDGTLIAGSPPRQSLSLPLSRQQQR